MSQAVGGREPRWPVATPPPRKRGRWALGLGILLAFITIVAVGASLNLNQPTAPGGEPPVEPPGPAWKHVVTFSGSDLEEALTTDSFNITGSKFRMTWNVTKADCFFVPEDICETFLQFRLVSTNATLGSLRHVIIGPSRGYAGLTGENTVREGGSFYLVVFDTIEVASWTIAVEEWK
ncbi:MAG: hypothetical protein ACE5IJ_03315 [Thermoplasmata archaeon]